MKLKEAVQENCAECGHFKKEITPESFGCDGCGKSIDDLYAKQHKNNQYNEYLKVTVFYDEPGGAEHLDFCSWKCVFKKIRTLNKRKVRFLSLPHVSYELNTKGMRTADLYKLVKG